MASFKSTLRFLRSFPICRGFSQKTVKYFGGHMKDAVFLPIFYKVYKIFYNGKVTLVKIELIASCQQLLS